MSFNKTDVNVKQEQETLELFVGVNLLYKSIKQFEVKQRSEPEEWNRPLGKREMINSLAFLDRESEILILEH